MDDCTILGDTRHCSRRLRRTTRISSGRFPRSNRWTGGPVSGPAILPHDLSTFKSATKWLWCVSFIIVIIVLVGMEARTCSRTMLAPHRQIASRHSAPAKTFIAIAKCTSERVPLPYHRQAHITYFYVDSASVFWFEVSIMPSNR